eukprot:gene51207-1447_t
MGLIESATAAAALRRAALDDALWRRLCAGEWGARWGHAPLPPP